MNETNGLPVFPQLPGFLSTLLALRRNLKHMSTSKEELFANELADTLGDQESLPFYQELVEKYSESFLRARLKKVMSMPPEQIRKTRGALFTYLIRQHERRFSDRD